MTDAVPSVSIRGASKSFGDVQALREVSLDFAPGEFVSLLGPSGCGKTSLLRIVGGFLEPDAGEVWVHGERMDGLPPNRRPVNTVFQSYALFSHKTVLGNVAFPLEVAKVGKAERRERVEEMLAMVRLEGFGERPVSALSGGQAQRVALARALVNHPELLLLDEPLAALDARTRLDTRVELQRHLAEHPGATLLVTHDPLDALVLADRLVVIEHGAVVQEGDAAAVTARPRTDYVARLVGLNLYRGHASGDGVRVGDGLTLVVTDRVAGDAFVAFRPSAVAVHNQRPEGSPRNVWAATVGGIQSHGDNLRVLLNGPIEAAADVTPAAAAELGLVPGQQVWASLKAAETHAYPA